MSLTTDRCVCDVTGRQQDSCVVAPMTSSAEEPRVAHVVSDVIAGQEARSLLLGSVDDMTSLRAPASRNIKVFVCSTGTG